VVVAVGVSLLAYNGGTYGHVDRGIVAIALLWTTILLVALGVWPTARVPYVAVVVTGLFAAFAAWVLLSTVWAPSAEDALTEFNRVSLYLTTLVLVVLASARGGAARWLDGIALGIVFVLVVALVSRLFHGTFELRGVPEFLPAARNRLSFPVDYWNGLAILLALGVPLLLRIAVEAPRAAFRGAALGTFPLMSAALFFTSSRGGVIVAVIGMVAFAAFGSRRMHVAGAATVAVIAAAGATWIVAGRKTLANGPLESDVAATEGQAAAVLLALLAAGTGFAWAVASRVLPPEISLRRGVRFALLAAAGLTAVVVLAMLDPIRAFDTFRQPPGAVAIAQADFAKAHLLSGGGSGRWQFWTAAGDQFREHPVSGAGAGSYESWWLEHASFPYFTRDAHSLFVEILGELGLVGFLFLASTFAAGIVAGARRLRESNAGDRNATAAALAAFIGFLIGAAIDWMWELTITSLVGVTLLAVLVGPATATPRSRLVPARNRFGFAVAAIAAAWLLLAAQVAPLLGEVQLRESQEAARRGDLPAAADAAGAARRLEPWAASPYLQLALIDEEVGDLGGATRWIDDAIARDTRDWRLWLVSARLHTKTGDVGRARQALRRAAQLNPLSPLFAAGSRRP
jgi:O-antigen ligase